MLCIYFFGKTSNFPPSALYFSYFWFSGLGLLFSFPLPYCWFGVLLLFFLGAAASSIVFPEDKDVTGSPEMFACWCGRTYMLPSTGQLPFTGRLPFAGRLLLTGQLPLTGHTLSTTHSCKFVFRHLLMIARHTDVSTFVAVQ